jgi:hypothetical protein
VSAYGDAVQAATHPDRSRAPRRWWWVLVGPVLAAAVAFAGLAEASEGFTAGGGVDAFVVGAVAWNLSPSVGLAILDVLVVTRLRRGVRLAAAGGGLLVVTTVGLVWSIRTSESSTAALGYLTGPFLGWAVVALTGLALVVASLRPNPR